MTGDGEAGHLVTVLPSAVSFRARPGETVFKAAYRNGIAWPTICGGQALCTRCRCEVVEGDPAPAGDVEAAALVRCRADEGMRLACQVRVTGDLVVRKDLD